jgi:signal transduction histidine kinase
MKKQVGSASLDFFIHPSSFFISVVPSRHSLPRTNLKSRLENVARRVLCQTAMSYLESTDKKASPLQPSGGGNHQENHKPDADRHISFTLAHELNNALTVVQGHADRLFVKHQEDTVLAPTLKKISEAARRAAELVRNAPKLDLNPPAA